MTTTAAAHIITASAEGLGEPEILVMTRDEGMGATLIARRSIPADMDRTWEFIDACETLGWRMTGDLTQVQRGYYVVDVERA